MDLLFTGGRVLTIDPLDRIASGVAVRDGRIIAVGDSDEVRKAVSPGAQTVDLHGRALVPGFCDPHNHFSMTTFEPRSVDCRVPPLAGKQAVLDAIAAAAAGSLPGQWIWGLHYVATPDMASGALTAHGFGRGGPAEPGLRDGLLLSRVLRQLGRVGAGRDRP